jgi:putative membrane protein (TIGR04086 family)
MRQERESENVFLMIMKGVTITMLTTLSLILLFAIVIKVSLLDSSVIKWVNQFLKIISIFVGVFFSIKGRLGFLKGGLVGLFSTVIIFIVFAFMGGDLTAGSTIIDSVFGAFIGAIVGVLAVNRKRAN